MPSEAALKREIEQRKKRKAESQKLIKKLTDEHAPKGAKKAFNNFKAALREVIRDAQKAIPALRKRLEQKRKGGAGKAVKWAKNQIGTTESPPYSNWGPEIGEWIKYTGYSGPVYWCGCFVCYAVVKVGGANIPNRVRLGYHLNIVADAKAGANGLHAVSVANAQPGDIVAFDFQHIALVTEPYDGSGYLDTCDGNTSPDSSGSQANGGGVWAKRRAVGDVLVVARPNY